MNLPAFQQFQKLSSPEDQISFLATAQIRSSICRAMLTDINGTILRNMLQQRFHPGKLFFSISLSVIMSASKSMVLVKSERFCCPQVTFPRTVRADVSAPHSMQMTTEKMKNDNLFIS